MGLTLQEEMLIDRAIGAEMRADAIDADTFTTDEVLDIIKAALTTPTAESKLREAVEKARDQFQMLEKLARAGRVKLAGKPYPKWDAVALEAAAGEDAMKSALRDAEGGVK